MDRLLNKILCTRDSLLKSQAVIKISELCDIWSTNNTIRMNTESIFKTDRIISPDKEYVYVSIRGSMIAFRDEEQIMEYDRITDDDQARQYFNPRKDLIRETGHKYRIFSGYDQWVPDAQIWKFMIGSDAKTEDDNGFKTPTRRSRRARVCQTTNTVENKTSKHFLGKRNGWQCTQTGSSKKRTWSKNHYLCHNLRTGYSYFY